ncbi:zinc-ribbon domain-containing protein [Maribius pontilimi]|uniref:Zinc-ribbon domain-containing protein n=1 Tax=Palleronia pontilimi TaxID=1964209 RepID=A0A934MF31_9RHOB|nr:zinc-ribbon domain-containing protein [Palleronia pontilimi]MBJ3764071.1 zinc-ribbon domain-containing protein [Palleronia pontilimi]
MRLICPNCAAQYEIDDSLIPEGGRDVQCSNCGHTWYEDHAEALTASADDAGATAGESLDKRPPRRELDAKTKQILREEAEREAAQRRAAAQAPVAEQTELGLTPEESSEPKGLQDLPDRFPEGEKTDKGAAAPQAPAPSESPPPDEVPAQSRAKVSRPDPDAARSAAAIAASSRGDLLPDIDQINSTLTATSERQKGADPADDYDDDRAPLPPSGSGFRIGFSVVLALTAIVMAVYLLAPQIADAIPTLEPTLASYVEAVNTFRATLDGWLISASEAIIGATDN